MNRPERKHNNESIITISGSLPPPIIQQSTGITTIKIINNQKSINIRNGGENLQNENQSIDNDNDNNNNSKKFDDNNITISDIIGEFGYFQLSISMLAFIRYVCVAMMTHTGSLIAPEVEFWCNIDDLINENGNRSNNFNINFNNSQNNYLEDFLKYKCNFKLNNGTLYECKKWDFNLNENGKTLTDSFNLVCEQDWYRSLYQSIVSIGLIMANVIWGSFSDRHGRKLTIQICFLWSLIFGLISCYIENFFIFSISRALCSFGDLGLVVSLITIIVETLGNKYRGSICIISYTGWAFGVMIMPWLTEYFKNFQSLMLFTVICHLITLPWILLTIKNDSIRWLLVNGFIDKAYNELLRINNWKNIFKNKDEKLIHIRDVNFKFQLLKKKFLFISEKKKLEKKVYESEWSLSKKIFMSIFGGLSKLKELFLIKELIIVTLTMIWITFNCELLYMTTILVNSDIGGDIKFNYALGLLMECIASVLAILMISKCTRKFSIISIILISSLLCFILANTHHLESISIWVLNLDKLAVSTLSSVIYITTTELYPTNLRQTGFGLTTTLGGLGSVVGPFVRGELKKLIGMTGVLYILACLPITAVIIIPFFLRETKDKELSDDMDDIGSESFDQNLRRRTSSLSSTANTNQQQSSPVTTV